MSLTVENVCGFLIRSKLMTADEMRQMYQRWQAHAKNAAGELNQFSKWLVASGYVTDYQAGLLLKGHSEGFFLNQYKILERIGRGRMAGVYKASHPLGQVVAIKVLPPSRSKHPTLSARFQREARLAMKLRHPNVVRTFQVGESDGLHYIVMEYLEGDTLEDMLKRRGTLAPGEAVRIIHQALMGLQHIHEQNMVHRDLKPANLMLVGAADDSTHKATVKVLDIGLGREFFDESAPKEPQFGLDAELTSEGMLLGTPDYLSPEQARDARSIDIRSDIYSLGCVLYHTLAGHPPFPDKNLLQQMIRHAKETPKPIREINPAVPDGLQQVLNWMLAKQPEERYPTPERAAQSLKMFLVAEEAPVARLEDQPSMRKYLTWLEMGDNGNEAASAPAARLMTAEDAPRVEPARAATARASPAAQPAAATPTEPKSGKHRHKDRHKHKHKHKHEKKEPAPAAVPVGRPFVPPAAAAQALPALTASPPTNQAHSLADVDVELVPLTELQRPAAKGISRRDWLFLGIGGGAVIAACIVGIIIKMILGWFAG